MADDDTPRPTPPEEQPDATPQTPTAPESESRRQIHRADHIGPEVGDVQEMHGPIVRERREPRDGYEPVPLWVISVCGVLLFWGGWYIGEYSGGWKWNVMDERPEARFTGRAAPGDADPLEVGEKTYRALCVSCHQAGGQGVPGQYPPLAGSQWVEGPSARIKRILLHGLEGPVVVKGETYDGNMPAFGDKLDDAQIAAVLTWVRQAFGNAAPPIPTESVAATREATRDRRAAWRAPELEGLEPDWTPPPPEPADGEGEGEGETEDDETGTEGDG